MSKLRVDQIETLDGVSLKNVATLIDNINDAEVTTDTGTQSLSEALNSRFSDGTASVSATDATVSQTLSDHAGKVLTLKDFGAVGDGSTDDSSAVQLAIDSGVAHIEGQGLTYKINSPLSLRSKLTFKNSVIDFSGAADGDTLFTAEGSYETLYTITSGGTKGSSIVTISEAGADTLSPGDIVRIQSTDSYDVSNTDTNVGELNIVEAANGTTGQVDLKIPLQSTYTTGKALRKIVPVESLVLYNVKAVGLSALENTQTALLIRGGRGNLVIGCEFERFDNRGIAFQDCMYCHSRDSVFNTARPTSTGYGISFLDATQDCSATGNSFQDVRHALSTNNTSDPGGIPRRILFEGNHITISAFALGGSMGGGDAIDTHGAAEEIIILGNTVVGSAGSGINFECKSGIISNNSIRGCLAHGIQIHNESDFDGDITCTGNRVGTTGELGIQLTQATRGATSVYLNAVVSNNVIINPGTMGLRVSTPGSQFNRGITVTGNSITNPATRGIWIDSVRNGTVSNNTVKDPGEYGMRIDDCIGLAVSGNGISLSDGATFPGIYATGSSAGSCVNLALTGNVIGTTTGSTTELGIEFTTNVENSLAVANITRQTGGVGIGTGTGNISANNVGA